MGKIEQAEAIVERTAHVSYEVEAPTERAKYKKIRHAFLSKSIAQISHQLKQLT